MLHALTDLVGGVVNLHIQDIEKYRRPSLLTNVSVQMQDIVRLHTNKVTFEFEHMLTTCHKPWLAACASQPTDSFMTATCWSSREKSGQKFMSRLVCFLYAQFLSLGEFMSDKWTPLQGESAHAWMFAIMTNTGIVDCIGLHQLNQKHILVGKVLEIMDNLLHNIAGGMYEPFCVMWMLCNTLVWDIMCNMWVAGDLQPSDMLTKGLPRTAFEKRRRVLMGE